MRCKLINIKVFIASTHFLENIYSNTMYALFVESIVPIVNTTGELQILLLAYMRGGSSYVGDLLGQHPGAFYLYEPLWLHSTWGYYHWAGECSIKKGNCMLTG
jgi:hypothetical protein